MQMPRMRLDHDRATGRQRRGGVTAEHGKREGEIAGREHGHRTQGHAHTHHGGVTNRWATGHGGVVGELEGIAAFGHVRKTAQLKCRAVQLTIEAHGPEGCFFVGQRDQAFAVCFKGARQAAQQGCTHAAGAGRPVAKAGSCSFSGGVDLGFGGGWERSAKGFAGTGFDGLKGFHDRRVVDSRNKGH